MYDATEIGLDWRGTLETISSASTATCAKMESYGRLRDYNGRLRAILEIDETLLDSTMGKLKWARRLCVIDQEYQDQLIKRPISQTHAKQEALIQWLCHKSLQSVNLGNHCARISDVFTESNSIWFSMFPVYKAPVLEAFLKTLPSWRQKNAINGQTLFRIIAQVAMCCLVLEHEIGFNHRDMKPDNILVKTDEIRAHKLIWQDSIEIRIASSPTAVLVDFGFSCLGPGKRPWIQSGDDVLSPFDACPRVGRDMFMLIVFLLWRPEVQESLIDEHLVFLKSSLHLTTERWSQLMRTSSNPVEWIYSLITEREFKCPAMEPLTWLQSCATKFPEVVSIRIHSGSKTDS